MELGLVVNKKPLSGALLIFLIFPIQTRQMRLAANYKLATAKGFGILKYLPIKLLNILINVIMLKFRTIRQMTYIFC